MIELPTKHNTSISYRPPPADYLIDRATAEARLGLIPYGTTNWREHGLIHSVRKGCRCYFWASNVEKLRALKERHGDDLFGFRAKAKVLAAEYRNKSDEPGWIERGLKT